MHESHSPSCDHCKMFIYAFSPDSFLSDWGFCLDQLGGVLPGQDWLTELETAAREGDYGKVCGARGLFQDTEDGCERYEPR
ncbi:MAG: hypothetical protein Q7O66_17350 [Dehalococcoidia bacterium]|nr:hypothetical protein [Dehalococcoidia bacterium]